MTYAICSSASLKAESTSSSDCSPDEEDGLTYEYVSINGKYYHGSTYAVTFGDAREYCEYLSGDWVLASVKTQADYQGVNYFNRGEYGKAGSALWGTFKWRV